MSRVSSLWIKESSQSIAFQIFMLQMSLCIDVVIICFSNIYSCVCALHNKLLCLKHSTVRETRWSFILHRRGTDPIRSDPDILLLPEPAFRFESTDITSRFPFYLLRMVSDQWFRPLGMIIDQLNCNCCRCSKIATLLIGRCPLKGDKDRLISLRYTGPLLRQHQSHLSISCTFWYSRLPFIILIYLPLCEHL